MTDQIEKAKTMDIVMPAVSSREAVESWKAYQDLKSKIVDPDKDIQIIANEQFLKKSYWRKLATFFNLTVEVIEERNEQIGRTLVWHFTCRAIAPNGRTAIGTGSCDAYEKAKLREGKYMNFNRYKKVWEYAQPNSIHNIRSTAETRAFNRAVSNLVGGGEVSAEEVGNDFQDVHEENRHVEEPQKLYINDFQTNKIIELSKEIGLTEIEAKLRAVEKTKTKSFDTIPLNKAGDYLLMLMKEVGDKERGSKS